MASKILLDDHGCDTYKIIVYAFAVGTEAVIPAKRNYKKHIFISGGKQIRCIAI